MPERRKRNLRSLLVLEPIQTDPQGNPAQPRTELLRFGQRRERTESAEQRLLGQVLGGVAEAILA